MKRIGKLSKHGAILKKHFGSSCVYSTVMSQSTTTASYSQDIATNSESSNATNTILRAMAYPIDTHHWTLPSKSRRIHQVYERTFSWTSSSPLLNIEVNTRNMNIEFCQGDQENQVQVQILTHNCNDGAWYDLNKTPQGFFSDYKVECLHRDLTNTLRINVHQAPVPSLFTRLKLYTYDMNGTVLPHFLTSFIENRLTKHATLRIVLPKQLNSLKTESDIGNVVFRGLSNVTQHCNVYSNFGTVFVGDGGLQNINQFHNNIMFGSCRVNRVNGLNQLKLNHLFAVVDYHGFASPISYYSRIQVDNIERDNTVLIHTADPIDIFLNSIHLGKSCNNHVQVISRTKDEPMTSTPNGIQLFISNSDSSSSNRREGVFSSLKVHSESNPIHCHFDKDVNYTTKLLASSQRSEVLFDDEHVLFDGMKDMGFLNGRVVSRKDTKTLTEISNVALEAEQQTTPIVDSLIEGGTVSLSSRVAPIYIKQFEYVTDEETIEQTANSTLVENRLITQMQDASKFYVKFLDWTVPKRDLFVYCIFAILIVTFVCIVKFYSLPQFRRQREIKEGGSLIFANTGNIRAAMGGDKLNLEKRESNK